MYAKSDLKAISSLRNLRQSRNYLGYSQSELADRIKPVKGNRPHVSKSLVAMWEAGERVMAQEQRDRVAQLIATRLSLRYHREIGVRITVNSPWHVTAHYWCERCNRYHELKKANQPSRCR